jgi:FkbM family methyltransferase
MPNIPSINSAFRDALLAQRSGPVGSELQASYPKEPEVVRTTTFWGDEMEVVLPELVSCELDRYGLIEAGVTRLFLDLVKPGTVVLDVGAHLGYYTLLASHLGADVHAFEPSPDTFSRLKRNAGTLAVLVPKGAWSEVGKLELRDFGEVHSAVASFFAPKDESLTSPIGTDTVDVVTIDDHVEASGIAPSLIKVDAEGAEEHVLRGARRTIATHRPVLTIEVGDASGSPRSRPAVDLALSLGYDVFDLTPEGRVPHEVRTEYGYGNLAFIPSG